MNRLTSISARVVGFCRLLREYGFPLGPAEEADSMRALELISIGNQEDFRTALRTVLARSRKEQEIFDRLFPEYWLKVVPKQPKELSSLMQLRPPSDRNRPRKVLLEWRSVQESESKDSSYSPDEILIEKDFSRYSEEDLHDAMRIVRSMARLLATRKTRRYRPSHRKRSIDLRNTIRKSLRTGGEPIALAFREKEIRHPKLVLFCDVSGSMDRYARFLLAFVYAFQHSSGKIETFAFSTNLYRITALLKQPSFDSVLQDLSLLVPDWSGGTRIGSSLKVFLDSYGSEMLTRDTIFVVLSDGWDVGDIDLLEESMRQIRERVRKILWLNPLAGSSDYQPVVSGMQAALPYIDLLLPVHNLESLESAVRAFVASR